MRIKIRPTAKSNEYHFGNKIQIARKRIFSRKRIGNERQGTLLVLK